MWEYHDKKMKELKQIYNKISKQTQNNLQSIFDTMKFTSENIYNIADMKTKQRANTYIEKWNEEGLLNGYFGVLARNIYKRTRVKNSEILELMIYGTYVEEQSKLQEQELNIFKKDANYYYQEGQKEVNKKKTSVIPDAIFLALLDIPNATGLNWQQYIQTILQYNAQQIYKQTLINIGQQKQLEIDSNEYQSIINNQIRQKVNINDNNISGATDIELIGLNNLAKIEGIKNVDSNSQVKFMAVIDGKETDMCHSLDGQLFYINKENVFDRYYGEIQKELSIQKIKCFGLVVGLNLPPISHHFHWCRSTITYQIPVEKEIKKVYNLDIARISKDIKPLLKNINLNSSVERLFNKYLTKDNVIVNNDNKKAMYYDIDEDKIIINPQHTDFKQYNLGEALTHEIVHMIDTRNKLLINNKNIYSNIRSAILDIDTKIDKYQKIFKDDKYFYDLCSGDTIGLLTGNKVRTFYYHPIGYANIEEDIIANIETAYLTNNKIALDLFNDNEILSKLKDKVVKMYDKYTR